VNESQIFIDALKLATPAARAAFLDATCSGDAQLRAGVEALLQAHASEPDFLEQPAGSLSGTINASTWASVIGAAEAQGTVIGPYKLIEQIGEGGMGTVWMAQQTEPVKRVVALKLIKAGMDSRQVIARFEAERQALALMDHANIARVLDAGTTSTGRPYFVMDLVKGVPITRYCDEHRLTPRRRLELFLPVCQAIQHAHQKGIIHRDLKPSNVLVALYDGKPVPRVIDFGVAKAAGESLTDKTLVTGFGNIVGTLEYMSPEQAEVNQLDIDTRSDIYSLGVLLYELLTGTTPFTKKDLEKAGMLEMLRVIREQEPSKPSTKLSTSEGLPTLAANRGTEPAKLTKLLRGELDWIVMKALEKDRNRRYETANGFAMDVQRYLADEPVLACPPSAGYRLRKFARRNKGPVSAAAVVLLTLLGGIVGTTIGLMRAQRERDAKEHARQQEEHERTYAQAIASFVKDDFLVLTSVEGQDLYGGQGAVQLNKDATLRQLLDRAAAKLNQRNDLEPRIEAELRWVIGVSYRGLGEAGLAIPFLERCVTLRKELFGPEHEATLSAQNSLAEGYRAAGKPDLALPLHQETLKLRQATLGARHPNTLMSMNHVAAAYLETGKLDLALPLFEQTLKLRQATLGADHHDTLKSMNNLASGYQAAGKLDLALPLFEETLNLRQATPVADQYETLKSMNNLAAAYLDAGKLDLALPLSEKTLKLMKAKQGADHPDTLRCMHSLARGYRDAGQFERALPLLEETLKLMKARLGADHPDTLRCMHSLAWGYRVAGKLDLALPLLEQTLKLTKARQGGDHPDTLMCMNNLGLGYQAAGKLNLALPLFEEALPLMKAKLGADHSDTLRGMNNLASGYRAAGKLDLALPLLEETLKVKKATLGADHPDTLRSMNNLASGYRAAGKLDLALPLLEEALRLFKDRLGADHPDTLTTMNNLGSAYWAAGKRDLALPLCREAAEGVEKRHFQHEHAESIIKNLIGCHEESRQFDQAVVWWRKWLTVVKDRSGTDSVAAAGVLAALGFNLLRQERWADAEAVLRECLAIRQKRQPDDWTTFNVRSLVGAALLGRQHYPEAESLLLAGYQGMLQREATIAKAGKVRLSEAAARLVQLYEALNNEAEAGRWRKELEARKAATQDQKPKAK
jgi:serine/threonine protein kinase